MSRADDIFANLSEEDIKLYSADPSTEAHIVVSKDRYITVPEELKRIGVQFDHDIETVTFDCPRYWDGIDMSKMKIYINYMRSDGIKGMYLAQNVTIDEIDDSIMHFEWTISKNVTMIDGQLSFLVCIKTTDDLGNEKNHWNSELNQEMTISKGLECSELVVELYPDIITQLLLRMDAVEYVVSPERIEDYVNDILQNSQTFIDGISKVITPKVIRDNIYDYLDLNESIVVEATLTTTWSEDPTNGYYTQTVSIPDIEVSHNPTLDVKLTGSLKNMESCLEEWSKVVRATSNDGSITFYAREATQKELTVLVEIGLLTEVEDVTPISDDELDDILV